MKSRFKQVSRNVSSKIQILYNFQLYLYQLADTGLAESHHDNKTPVMFLPDKLEGVALAEPFKIRINNMVCKSYTNI